MNLRIRIITYFLIIHFVGYSQNQETRLSVEKIMQDPDSWIGSLPEDIVWSEDSRDIYFKWNPNNNSSNNLYRITTKDLKPEEVTLDKQKVTSQRNDSYSKDGNRKVYVKSGDIFLYDKAKNQINQITHNLGNIRSAVFTSDEKEIVFEQDNNLYLWSFESGAITRLTNIQKRRSVIRSEKSKDRKSVV